MGEHASGGKVQRIRRIRLLGGHAPLHRREAGQPVFMGETLQEQARTARMAFVGAGPEDAVLALDTRRADARVIRRPAAAGTAQLGKGRDGIRRDMLALAEAGSQRGQDVDVAAHAVRRGHGLPAQDVYDYVSAPYLPYLSDEFTFTRTFVRDAMQRIIDVKGPYADVINRLNMPVSFVILDRVVWGVSAILGKLEVTGPWRGMLLEYRTGGPPATPMGEAEQAWLAAERPD